MPSTYSSNLKLELMATGENSGTWGNITNTNLGTAVEQAIVGYGNPNYASDANLTISITNSNAAQAARALVLNVTSSLSLTATRELVVPTIEKQYIVQNNTTGSQSITVKTSAGTGITVPNGRKAHLYVDGTNVIQMFDFVDINGGTIDGTPIGGSSTSTGAFTTLSASGAATFNGAVTLGDAAADLIVFNGTVNSHLLFTDNTYDIGASGATRPRNLFLAGNATVGGNLSVGGTLTLTGGLILNGNVTVGDSSADTLTVNATITSNLLFTDNTYDIGASGATRPRNLFLAGNATIGGNTTMTGTLTVDSTTDSTSIITGSIQTDGGMGVAKALYVGTTLNVAGQANFNNDPVAAVFQGATQGSINIQKTGTSGFGVYSSAAGVLSFYNNSAGRDEVRINSTGMIVGPNISTELPAVPLNIYNGNTNGELLRLEGLGSRTGWNGFKFTTSGVANRHTVFNQDGVSLNITQYETSTGNSATDGQVFFYTNYWNVYNYNGTSAVLRTTTDGLAVGNPNINVISGAKNVTIGTYLNAYSFSSGYGGIEQNAYNDGTWRFNTTNYATMYQSYVGDGQHVWYSSTAAGAGGTAVTWQQLMKLNRDSRLIAGTGQNFGAQALTTPGINIGTDASGQGLSIINADGASSATDARLLIGNGSSSYGALRFVFNSTSFVTLDAVTWGSTAVQKDLGINVNGGSVGVGIATPSTYGKVVSYGGTFALVTDSASQRRLSFWSTANGNSENGYIQVQNDGATTNTGEILFATRNASGTLAERGRFTAAGTWQVTGASGVNTAKEYNVTRWSLSTSAPEGLNYQRFKVTIGATRVSALCRIRAMINPDGGISYQQGAEMIVAVARIDGGAVANILSVQSAVQMSISEPQTSGNDVIFGLVSGFNGTGTSPNVQVVVDYLAASPTSFTWAEVTGTTAAGTSTQGLMKFNPSQNISNAVVMSAYGVGLGNTAPSSGTGIAFPATQSASSNANTLDDYEEGSFTPTFNTTNGDLANFSYNVQYGNYTKVGNVVTVFISLATINAASISGTGDVVINGLPFAVATQSNGVNAIALTHDNRWATNPQFAQCQRTTTSLTLFKNNLMQSGGSSALQRTDFNATNGGNFNIVTVLFTYFVA